MGNREKRKRRERDVRKRLARDRAQSDRSKKPAPPDRFSVTYRDPDALCTLGPLVTAHWRVPDAFAAHLRARGLPVPPPVVGSMLIDTGARHTCMDLEVARFLGLKAVRIQPSYGAHGLQQNEVFEAILELSILDEYGARTTLTSARQAMGIPELGRHLAMVPVETATGITSVRLIGLLGRDLLRHMTFTYRGHPDGNRSASIDVRLHLDSLPQPPKV